MIRGIGIDSVAIERCMVWQNYSASQLKRIFLPEEIAYCFSHAPSTVQRLAAHFAVKEASYKAVCSAYHGIHIPFLTLCRLIELTCKSNQAPTLSIAWTGIQQFYPAIKPLKTHVSITHTHTYATAIVFLEK